MSGTALDRAHELLKHSDVDVRQLQPAGSGNQHDLFVVEVDDGPFQLLRIPHEDRRERMRKVLASEAEAVHLARGILPVADPTTLLYLDGVAEGTLQPILPGERASNLRDRAALNSRSLGAKLGVLLANLHSMQLQPDQNTQIRKVLEDQVEGSPTLLHGDLHLGNVLVDFTPKGSLRITGIVDWSFCAWGPPEADLVEMAICEASRHSALGRTFYRSYREAGGPPPREEVFHIALARELERRLVEHQQARETFVRDFWTRWLQALKRPDAQALRVFAPGSSLT